MLGPELQQIDRDYVLFCGRKLLYLAGIDYHRMSTHPQVVRAAIEAAQQHGLSPTGSRTTTGNHVLYAQLERTISQFFASETAVVCPSGYLSNLMLLQAIQRDYDAFFIDEQAHSSLVDAASRFDKPLIRFTHVDAQSLADRIKQHSTRTSRPLVLTDGVFPARGETPPLADFAEILKPHAGKIVIDDAHAMGVLGATGKGSWEAHGISRETLFQTGSLAKGFGVGGGVIPVDHAAASAIHANSMAFVGSTGLSLPSAAAICESVSLLSENQRLITELQSRSLALKKRFADFGFPMPETPVPIFSITLGDKEKNRRLSERLLEHGVYPPLINYPGSPTGGHFRFILTSCTTPEQEDLLFESIASSVDQIGWGDCD